MRWIRNIAVRNFIGLLLLFAIFYVSDRHSFDHRTGFNKLSPYIFLVLFYGWIVFHNRVLFEKFFLTGNRRWYFIWTSLALLISTFNMFFIIYFAFDVKNPLPQILTFWIFSVLGAGVFVITRTFIDNPENSIPVIKSDTGPENTPDASHIVYNLDGRTKKVKFDEITFVESMENYVKVHTKDQTHIIRKTLKEIEDVLPKPSFLRVSRSHIVNTTSASLLNTDTLVINQMEFRIGKVYKKYVIDQLEKKR